MDVGAPGAFLFGFVLIVAGVCVLWRRGSLASFQESAEEQAAAMPRHPLAAFLTRWLFPRGARYGREQRRRTSAWAFICMGTLFVVLALYDTFAPAAVSR
jgi:hypothetical protein